MRLPLIVVKISALVFSQFSTHRWCHAIECVMSAMPILVVLVIEEFSLEITF